MGMVDPTQRFSGRVEDYVRYRPHYPSGVSELLEASCGLHPGAAVADIGSGTGILSQMLLSVGCRVYGVEPNPEMREAGERLLCGFPLFASVDGAAEASTLPDASVDLVTAGQAFHWFDRPRCRTEFVRILRPGGSVALIWNKRRKDADPFARAYEKLLRTWATDYEKVDHENVTDAMIAAFFHPSTFVLRAFPNRQTFDYEALEGRLRSSSYAPPSGHPNHAPMRAELRAAFDEHNLDGTVSFEYDTAVYFGRL